MDVLRKALGPLSKYDRSLPYTYMAKSPIVEGDEEVFSYYFADTICGLIEYLDQKKIAPAEVELYGLYLKQEILLEKEYCIAPSGKWLKRPEICHSLERHYKETLEERYRGHIEIGECSFEDRDRQGSGPY